MFHKSRITGFSLIALSAIFLVVGLSTYFWPVTQGTVVSYDSYSINTAGSSPGVGGGNITKGGSSSSEWQWMSYDYSVEEHQYHSSLIGYYLPFNIDLEWVRYTHHWPSYKRNYDEIIGLNVSVHYLPILNFVSVVKPGPDYRLVIFLAFIGYFVLFFRGLAVRYVSNE